MSETGVRKSPEDLEWLERLRILNGSVDNRDYADMVEKSSISSQHELKKAIKYLLDDTFIGIRALFLTGGVATTVESWGKLLYGLLSERYEMEDFGEEDCADIVETLKAENRKEEFLRIIEFFGYFNDSSTDVPYSQENFEEKLQRDKVLVEEKDKKILKRIFDNYGDRSALEEDPKQVFVIGGDEFSMDEKELKAKLDDLLGDDVNWGHEITDCMGDSGKKGELYYYQSGKGLTEVGNSSQSHASSKGGRTLIWEMSGAKTEILAIGKHTTRADSRLSKGASYEIIKGFAGDYPAYENKIVGFKSS